MRFTIKQILFFCLLSVLLFICFKKYNNKIAYECFEVNGFITFKQLGSFGDLGNQLYQMAATIGVAKRNNLRVLFPKWKYTLYFPDTNNLTFVDDNYFHDKSLNLLWENQANFEMLKLDDKLNYDLSGYRQSDLYFSEIKDEIIKLFTPDKSYLENVKNKFPILKENNTISVHIRRGDYTSLSDLYVQLSDDYYYSAVNYIKNKISSTCVIIIVSNDKQWVQNNMPKLNSFENIYYSPFDSQLDDFSTLYLCKYHVNANSSYSWWASYLSQSTIVVAPSKYYTGNFTDKNTSDLYPKQCTLFDNEGNLVYEVNNNSIIPSKFYQLNLGENSNNSNIVIMLLSCRKNLNKIDSIKTSWLNNVYYNLGIKYVILLGDTNLQQGDYKFDDRTGHLYLGCQDNYDDLVYKICYGLKAVKKIYNPDKIFKIDDDVLVNVDRFSNYLNTFTNNQYEGKVVNRSKGEIDFWSTTKYENPKNKKPTSLTSDVSYCGGPFYFLGPKAIEILLTCMNPKESKYEDMCVGLTLNRYNIFPKDTNLYTDYDLYFENNVGLHNYKF